MKLTLKRIVNVGTSYPAGKSGRRGWSCSPAHTVLHFVGGSTKYVPGDLPYGAAIKLAKECGYETSQFEVAFEEFKRTGVRPAFFDTTI